MERRAAIALGIFLASAPAGLALNPSLDIDQYAHKAWTVREGFFTGAINSIAQTPDGYLWLGTEFGLLRFDGVQRVPWQPPAGQQLPSSFVHSLVEARDGRLWIGTDAGLASWKDGKLIQYPELAGQAVVSLIEDREGTIWAGTFGTPSGRLCAIQSGIAHCYGEDGGFGDQVLSVYEDSRGNLWAGASTGLWRWKPGPPKLYPVPAPPQINALIDGANGALLFVAGSELNQLLGGKSEAYSLPGVGRQFGPRSLLRDRDGSLWIGTADRGLLHFHQGRTDVFAQPEGLSGDRIQSLFEDREGNIWVSTQDGLDRFRDFAVPTISVKQGLSGTGVWSILAARDGSVWVGTRDGLNQWKDGQITIYWKGSGGLPDTVDSLFLDEGSRQGEAGRVLVSTLDGVGWFENGRFTPISAVPSAQVHAIAGDNAGNLWIGGDEAMFHLSQEKLVEQIPWARLGQGPATTLLSDSEGGVWIGFLKGGVAYFKGGQVRASFSVSDGLGQGFVGGLQLDGDGKLWAATEGGLSLLKDGLLKNGHIATLTSRNGLPCDSVHWSVEDDDHSSWLYMSCGLVRVARPELDAWVLDPKRIIQVTVFDTSDGVRSHPGNNVSGYSPRVTKTTDGKLWFLSGDGVSVIDPRHLPVNKLLPPVSIEQIVADRKIYAVDAALKLPALTRDLEIDYTALSLAAPEKNRFRIKLEGRDPDWKDMGNERKAFYNDLPPRHYRFRVMASNNNGVWNEAGAAFDFSVAPAYYQTSWFQASCGIAFLAVLWGLYRYRLHQVAREFNVRLDERVSERTRVARDLHDTLLQSFQGLMLRLQVVDDQIPPGKLKEQLEETLERGDRAIAEGRDAVHDLRSSTTTTNDLAQAVRTVASELAEKGSTTFRLVVEGPVRDLHPIIRDELYRIGREALRNAFSHAKARHIEAEITYAEKLLRLRIRDDGQGIPPAILEEGRPGHYGLPGMRERAKQIGAEFGIWSGAGAGTEIDVTIAGSIAYGPSARGGSSGGTWPGGSRLRLFRKPAAGTKKAG